MLVSASQPYFAPFPGLFSKAHLSDVFVLLDEVQFPRGATWVSRNRFKNHLGALWMSIPVHRKGLGLQRINRVRIQREGSWERKHLESLETAYAHAPYFSEHRDLVREMFSGKFERLVDLNLTVIRYLMRHLDIDTEVELLSQLGIEATGDRRLIAICRKLGANRFLAQAPARKYLDADLFAREGIALEFFQPPSPVYPQLWGEFIPNLSALDLLFNCGPKSRDILLGRYARGNPNPPAGE
ncbi:MAG: WbqC family protein [Deltaproteobacteria bacterium]|nr:WbqC family protein [Deltaproteobacteria bacterium]